MTPYQSATKYKEIVERLDLPTVEEIDAKLDAGREDSSHRWRHYSFPRGVDLLKLDSYMEIIMDWKFLSNKFTLLFATMWNAILLVMLTVVVAAGAVTGALFLLPFILIGGWVAYQSVAYLVNKSIVTVNDQYIEVTSTPVAHVMKDFKISVSDVQQVFTKRMVAGKVNDEPRYSYGIWIRTRDGKDTPLIVNLKEIDHARFIEYQIESYTSITDSEIKGEA